MEHASLDILYNEITLLSEFDRYKLYHRMQKDFYQNIETFACTLTGKPLTKSDYIEQIRIGLRQIENGAMITDEELQKEIGTW